MGLPESRLAWAEDGRARTSRLQRVFLECDAAQRQPRRAPKARGSPRSKRTDTAPVFPITIVPDDARDLIEQLGSKPKFWFHKPDGGHWLYKEARQNTGEDWSEKVAAELSNLLGLPHATYELATWRDKRGVVTPSFVPQGGRLVLGNELLAKLVVGYPGAKSFRTKQHTLKRVLAIVKSARLIRVPLEWASFPGVESAVAVFVGYIMLDAWIGNTDRHHENWALVVSPQMSIHLAPTYDHASSLGRNESDQERSTRLTTKDEGRTVERYAARADSAFYTSGRSKPLTTFEAFVEAGRICPAAARSWLERLELISVTQVLHIFEQVPAHLISEPAVQFAQRILEINRDRLLGLKGSL